MSREITKEGQGCLLTRIMLAALLACPGLCRGGGPPLGDRLILELNRDSFSQRQAEVYLLVRSLTGSGRPVRALATDGSAWQESLEQFRDDMMVFLETRRLGRFQPENAQIQQKAERLLWLARQRPYLKHSFTQLGIDRWTSLRTIAMVMQVEEFRRLKAGTGDHRWFSSLEQRYVVRWFDGSEQYLLIRPGVWKTPRL